MQLKSHRLLFSFLIVAAAGIVLVGFNLGATEINPGSSWGVAYGTFASALLIGAMLYAARRRAPARGPGAVRHWLSFHVYGGTLFLLLVFMHTGFRIPTGAMDLALWLLSIWIVASGLLGVLVQRWIPRILTSGLTTEVHFDRLQELTDSLRERSTELVQACDPSVQDFFRRELEPQLKAPRWRTIYFVDITGGIQSHVRRFQYLTRFLPDEEAERLMELRALFVSKLELDAHFTLQRALRLWLYGHVPLSIVLMVLWGFHLFFVIYY